MKFNSQETFNNVDKWVEFVRNEEKNKYDIKIILVGNKSDLIDDREVTYENGQKKNNDLKLNGFFEVSAKNEDNINILFKHICRLLYKDIFNDEEINIKEKKDLKLKLHDGNIRRRGICCC